MAILAGSRRARTGSGDGLMTQTRPGVPVSLGVRPPAPGVVLVGGGAPRDNRGGKARQERGGAGSGGVSEGWNRRQFEHVGEHRRDELFEDQG